MSKKRWAIFIFALLILFMIVITLFFYQRGKTSSPQDQKGIELVEMVPEKENFEQDNFTQLSTKSKPAAVEMKKEEYHFVLVNDNQYVTVYKLPEYELYEYTDVILEVLPVELQEEVKTGKYLKNEEELYNFLENYTS